MFLTQLDKKISKRFPFLFFSFLFENKTPSPPFFLNHLNFYM